jgi:hypothetical protein
VLSFVATLPEHKTYGLDFNIGVSLQAILEVYKLAEKYEMKELADKTAGLLNRYYGGMPGK